MAILTVPKHLVERTQEWVHFKHVNFMASSHHMSGDCKLNFYTTAQAPLLTEPMSMDSAPVEDGTQIIMFTEYYTSMAGLLDHWKKGSESGMLPAFMELLNEGVKAEFIQPLQILHEVNALPEGSAGANFSGCCQVKVKFVVPKEQFDEALAMMDAHAKWIKETHLESHGVFTGDKKLLFYSVGTCPLLTNPMDLESAPDPDGKQIIVFTEYYQTKAGLEKHWEMAPVEPESAKVLQTMNELTAKGMTAEFYQPMVVKGSINWSSRGDVASPREVEQMK